MRFILIGLIIYSFWNPNFASLIFIIIVSLLELWLFMAGQSYKKRVLKDEEKFTEAEKRVYNKFRIFFNVPTFSRMLSPSFSLIQLAPIILTPWLLIKGLFIQGILIALNYFIANNYAVTLNPQFFLHDAVEKRNKLEFKEDMGAVDSLLEKLYIKK